MKQNIHFLLLLLSILLPATATAYDFEVDGIYYNINGDEATVTYKSNSDGDYISDYCGNIDIPGSVTHSNKSYPVTAIGLFAFNNCADLISITIPNSITRINGWAFFNCTGLTSITIPNSVTYIGDCTFEGCTGLTSIRISNSVTSIGVGSFCNCSKLSSIIVDIENPNYDSRDNCNAIIETNSNMMISGCMNTVIPNSVTSIGDCAFEGCSGLTNITIPNSVTYIGGFAFDGCSCLSSVTIPKSVNTIDYGAFAGCSNLTNVTIGSGVTSIGFEAFNYCNALETVKCLGTVTPVMASSDCFTTTAYNRATLLVPRNSEAAYSAADYWYKFAHFEGWGSAGMGDVNGDGIMSIADVTFLIDVLLTGDYEGIYFESADLNSNGRLDIGDVTSLIDNLLNN